jgi:hypothetical protein
MMFLCLAYGAEEDWNRLSEGEQEALLAQDEVLRERGALIAAVETSTVTVRSWDGMPEVTDGGFAHPDAPLAGFYVLEAADLEEAVRLVADTPCARARGAVEVRPLHEGKG